MIQLLADRHRQKIAYVLMLVFFVESVHGGGTGNAPYGRFTGNAFYSRADRSLAPFWTYGQGIAGITAKGGGAISLEVPGLPKGPKNVKKYSFMPSGGGPSQPEMQSFQSVNNSNMVDLFTGDFSYNIPLMDVGGYPVNIAYSSGVSMDQEASWVGLGWNINPGTVTRNMRGLPDDFNGTDSVSKTMSVKTDTTIGVTGDFGVELTGLPLDLSASLGIFHDGFRGWGLETGLNASLNAGVKSFGSFTGGLSVTNNSQQGITISPSLSLSVARGDNEIKGDGLGGSLSISAPYNTRGGIKGLQVSAGLRQYNKDIDNQKHSTGSEFSSSISFAAPSFNPTITLPYTSKQYTFTVKVGSEAWTLHPNVSLSGYITTQGIARADTTLVLPAYGYLNYQNGASNAGALLDYNREKEIQPYRDNPAIPNIAIPNYTYDVFSITGEGTGGMFRPYRGDIGFMYDHYMRTKDASDRLSLDIGIGSIVHGGVDLNINRSYTVSGPWLDENNLKNAVAFRNPAGTFEAAYFRNPGEKAINATGFYNAIGGDDVVAVNLYQNNTNSPVTTATNYLTRYRNKKIVGYDTLNYTNAQKNTRDKRTQVISYLTAQEAGNAGLSKYIDNYSLNQFGIHNCGQAVLFDPTGVGLGLQGYYFNNPNLSGTALYQRVDTTVYFDWGGGNPFPGSLYPQNQFPAALFSARWLGRLQAPSTGAYTFTTTSDDGVRLWLNDSLLINFWSDHPPLSKTATVNLIAGTFYTIKIEYYQRYERDVMKLVWTPPGASAAVPVPKKYLSLPSYADSFVVNNVITKENRINSYRKANHISEIDVLNSDGRRYVYGIPVYNLVQREVSFAVDPSKGNIGEGLVNYSATDNSTNNNQGKDNFYSREDIPAYAHSFLLTGILSPDYVDLTGDGISDDDLGDAIKFNYTKVCGIGNTYKWRAPYVTDSATYNEGLRTYSRDDKGSYVYGEKELWYLNSVESKNMIATFWVSNRKDLLDIDEYGNKDSLSHLGKKLDSITLYTKADFMQHGVGATSIKTVHFEYCYQLCRGINRPLNDSGKLTLKKIWFTYNGNDKGKLNPYIFHYHPNNPRYNTKYYDRWGNYKDPLQNPGSSTGNLITNAEYPYSIQDSATAAFNAGAWTLDSIKLPSGGKIKVNYESDDYAYVQNRRAAQMLKIVGFSSSVPSAGTYKNQLYNEPVSPLNHDPGNLYAVVKVPVSVTSNKDVYNKYLDGLGKIYFRLYVQMPSDVWGGGSEYVPCYADLDTSNPNGYYGHIDANTIWVKIQGTSVAGSTTFSPLAMAAIQFLRLNLPSKAYPNSEINGTLDIQTAVNIIESMAGNMLDILQSFNSTATHNGWANLVDTSRSLVRLDCPSYKKYGGGLRVKSVIIYDNWNAMTGQKESTYGQVYDYTTTTQINGHDTLISSGVASYEPMLGGDENPFRQPIEYVDKIAPLAPSSHMYTEQPLGETFYPSASVGYRQVRVRSIHTTNTKSANGYEETKFYTAYDFPTLTDWTVLDNNTMKRYKPGLANFLHIDAKHYLTMSQGFKVELNDMNGKLRSQATYPETDPNNPISYTENFYKVDDQSAQFKHLANKVAVIDSAGNIDTVGTIGKDAELMLDMREQESVSNGNNFNVNGDFFTLGIIPALIPDLLNLAQREETRFRSVSAMKVIQRYGILDSVVHIDKGSKVSTKDLLYDAETGDVLLTRTNNEFNDPIYNFTYPTHWAYDGMGEGYRNIGTVFGNINILDGKITSGIPAGTDTVFFSGGDELLIASKPKTGNFTSCLNTPYATFPTWEKIWAVDTSMSAGGTKAIYFVDQAGTPFSGSDVSLKIIRSGRRNINGSVGSVATLANPLLRDSTGKYHIVLNTASKVISTTAAEYRQVWKVADKRKADVAVSCAAVPYDSTAQAGSCACLRGLFDYLIASKRLFITQPANITVDSLVNAANNAGFSVSTSGCPVLSNSTGKLFYALTYDTSGSIYQAQVGSYTVTMASSSGLPLSFYRLGHDSCNGDGTVHYQYIDSSYVASSDTLTLNIPADYSVIKNYSTDYYLDTNYNRVYTDISSDSTSNKISSEFYFATDTLPVRNAITAIRFSGISQIPSGAQITSVLLQLYADHRGHLPPAVTNANSDTDNATVNVLPNFNWGFNTSVNAFLDSAAGLWDPISPVSPTTVGNHFLDATFDLTAAIYNEQNYDGFIGNSLYVSQAGIHGSLFGKEPMDSLLYSTYYSQKYADSTPLLTIKYIPASHPDTMAAILSVNFSVACDTVRSRGCYSAVTDTVVNPYLYGILGNFRLYRNYVYYGRRAESDPSVATNVRKNGTFNDYAPFWLFQGAGLMPQYDTTRWVWNSQTDLFNSKGYEVENNDPLGRYNSGLYGYNLTLPTAVTQNARYQETAFEGFEDYNYNSASCDSACSVGRHFDFSPYQYYLTTSQQHSGKYSLQLPADSSVGIYATVNPLYDTTQPHLAYTPLTDSCGTQLKGITASNTLLPVFSPYAGKKMVFSAWVKEAKDCHCSGYTADTIKAVFTAGGTTTEALFNAQGNIIEGWQRYEAVFTIPSNASSIAIVLKASDSSATYFDDIRIHPFNADMKSFVYNPVNLRLMAELDENNYATFYEYDDDGTLIRVKKETERGVMTIKETHSALIKDTAQ